MSQKEAKEALGPKERLGCRKQRDKVDKKGMEERMRGAGGARRALRPLPPLARRTSFWSRDVGRGAG